MSGGGGMGMTSWVGGAMSGTGSAMQFMAQGKRERAQNRVAGRMRAETAKYGAEKFAVSDTLRKALDSIADAHQTNRDDFIARRNSPDRQLASEQLQDQRVAASQTGLNKALAAVNGPPGAYRGVDSVISPGQAVTTPGAVPTGSALDKSMQIYGQREQPMLNGVLSQLSNEGYLTGGANFDTHSAEKLALQQRPLDNEASLRQLLTGLRQGETGLDHGNRMMQLGQDMENANKVGSNEMLWGSIIQNIGAGVSGSSDFSYQSANGGAPAEANGGNPGGAGAPALQPPSDAQYQDWLNQQQQQLQQPGMYENSDYVPNYGS